MKLLLDLCLIITLIVFLVCAVRCLPKVADWEDSRKNDRKK